MKTEKTRYLAWVRHEQDVKGLIDIKFVLDEDIAAPDEEGLYREANLINALHEQRKQIARPDVV